MNLSWSGGSATVDILRQLPGETTLSLLTTTSNGGSYRDTVGKNALSGTYTYLVCNAGTSDCSNTANGQVP